MIKKVFLLCLLFGIFLVGCEFQNISEVLFIASVGFEKTEEGYAGFFYLPMSDDIGKSDTAEGKGSGQYAKVEGKNISEVFQNIQISTELKINMRHASSMVFNVELLNDEFIEEFIQFIKNASCIDFNFYLFATEDKMEDVYSFENPNKESVLNSVLVSSMDSPSIYLAAQPIHFLEFCRMYYTDRSIQLPLLLVEKIWTIDSEEVQSYHCADCVYFYQNQVRVVKDDAGSPYLKTNKHFYDVLESYQIGLLNYHLTIDYENLLKITVESKYVKFTADFIEPQQIEHHIENRIQTYLTTWKDIDPLNLEYYNKVYRKESSYDNVRIDILLTSY